MRWPENERRRERYDVIRFTNEPDRLANTGRIGGGLCFGQKVGELAQSARVLPQPGNFSPQSGEFEHILFGKGRLGAGLRRDIGIQLCCRRKRA